MDVIRRLSTAALTASLLMAGCGGELEVADDGPLGAQGKITLAPVLTVSPNPIPDGTTSLVLAGSGFRVRTSYQILVSDRLVSAWATTDDAGSFSTVYSSGGYPFGFNSDLGAIRFSAVAVKARTPGATTMAAIAPLPGQFPVTCSATAVAVGAPITIRGAGASPGQTIIAAIDKGVLYANEVSGVADADGNFALTASIWWAWGGTHGVVIQEIPGLWAGPIGACLIEIG